MAVDEAVDPCGLLFVEPGTQQHLGGILRCERPDGHGPQQLAERRPPRRARRVARRHDDARVPGQRRQELLAQPRVDEPQAFGGVDRHDDRPGQLGECRRSAVRRRAEAALEGGEEARGRGLDLAAVDGDERCAALDGLDPEGPYERRLARAGHAVRDGHERPVVGEQRAEARELAVAADDGAAALGQDRAEVARHALSR